jgi:hypothetical protein
MAAPRKNPPTNAISETERLAAQDYSIIGIARALGVSKETFTNANAMFLPKCRHRYREFKEAD